MSVAVTNGLPPALDGELVDPITLAEQAMRESLDDHVLDLRNLLTRESQRRAMLEHLLAQAKEHERRIAKAILVLDGDSAQSPATPTSTASPTNGRGKAKRPLSKTDWTISEGRVAQVLADLERWQGEHPGEGITPTQFQRWMRAQGQGAGVETLMRAFVKLRERELIRVAGRTRGGGTLYALMPRAADEDTQHAG